MNLLPINAKNTGPHPITMRSLSSQQPNTPTPSASLAADPTSSTPHCSTSTPTTTSLGTVNSPPALASPSAAALEIKNSRLKEELAPRSTRDVHASCVVTRHQASQYDSSTDCCLDQRRTSLRDLVSSLRTTIEAEATELRTEKMSCDGSKENTVEKWIVQNSKNGPIKVKNRYDI
ncbi:hypothetical protein J6590_063290 [Homalodisca vitripennis]|nr:hypothetical protein J6590_063290 [Homalodisca vitripennis]